MELDEETILCTEGGECHEQSPHTNTALNTGDTNPMISPTISTSIHTTGNHRSGAHIVYNGVEGCVADTGVLPNSRLEQAIQQESIEESFYSTSSQEKEKQSTCAQDNDSTCSRSLNKDIPSQSQAIGGDMAALNECHDEMEVLKELVGLEVGDLEESQLMVSASPMGDQTAPSTHVQLTPPHSAL